MTAEPPAEDLIRYDVMVQDALLGVVRKVLQDAARYGLPGEHHFYVTFRSHGPGVKISPRLREKYPDEMTIVLQHQFWDLIVGETNFEVGLSFGGVPERLFVPYEALTGFYDPSVQFGLKFTPDEAQADNDSGETGDVKETLDAISTLGRKGKRAPETQDIAPLAVIETEDAKDAEDKEPVVARAAKKPRAKADSETPEDGKRDEVAVKPETEKAPAGAEVVSLEAFRKKK
jgi:hypothetical protein